MIALIVPPFPAVSRPSKITITRRPLCTTHCWSLHSSVCNFFSSFAYFFAPILESSSSDTSLAMRTSRGRALPLSVVLANKGDRLVGGVDAARDVQILGIHQRELRLQQV